MKVPSGPILCFPNIKSSGKERKKPGEYRVNFPLGHSSWSQKISDLSLPEQGINPRLSGWPVPHEFSFLKSFSASGFHCILFTPCTTLVTLRPALIALLGHHFSRQSIFSSWSSAPMKVILYISVCSLENVAIFNRSMILNQFGPGL